MDKDMFDELMKSVKEMDRIVKGLSVDEAGDDDGEISNSCIE
jgi:hypothetical protein